MRILLLILFFPLLTLANTDRVISFEWESVSGASGYEVLFSSPTFTKTFKTKLATSDFSLPPGIYQVKIRSLDSRKVPGPWGGAEKLVVNHSSPKVSYQNKNSNGFVSLEIDSKFDKLEIQTSGENKKHNGSKLNLSLPPGKHSLIITAFKKDIPSDPTSIMVEMYSEKLATPRPNYFSNKIIWPKVSNASKYLVKVDGKKSILKDNQLEINSEVSQKVEVQALGESSYYPPSETAQFIYDPLKEKYFSLLSKQIYVSYGTGTYKYGNTDYNSNSTVSFDNISSLGEIGFSYQENFGIDLHLNFTSFMLDNKSYMTQEAGAEVNYRYNYSVRNKFLFSLSQTLSEQFLFSAQSGNLSENKSSYSFTSIGIENNYFLNQRFMIRSKLQLGQNMMSPELSFLYKLSPTYFGSVGFQHKKYQFNDLEVQTNFLMINLSYGWD